MDIKELRAVCKALDILIWKIPDSPNGDLPELIAAELCDKHIHIEWDKKHEIFQIRKELNG